MTAADTHTHSLPSLLRWTLPGRALLFALSAASIWCLLAEFYRLCTMRTFTLWVLVPATLLLAAIALIDLLRGDRLLWRAVVIGAVGGLLAAFAYDLFRLPFVIAAVDHLGPQWLRMPLYHVFPQFGAMILGQSFSSAQTDSQFMLSEHLLGWLYHFSNGMTFGVMYLALIGDAARRTWWWAVALAVGLELSMLFTPYTGFFGIPLATRFVIVTLCAHLIFGIVLGRYANRQWQRSFAAPAPAAASA